MVIQISNQESNLVKRWFGKQNSDTELNLEVVNKIIKIKKIIANSPFVDQVGVCNSVTLGLGDEESDIDLFIVTQKGRLYITRLYLVVLFHLFGIRRHGNKVKGRFCLSFLVDRNNIDMSDLKIQNDYYMRLWEKNVWWLLDEAEFLDEWRRVNNVDFVQVLFGWEKSVVARGFERLFPSFLMDKLEFLVGIIQRLIAHKKYVQKNFPKGVVFEEGVVKCHDQDVRWKIRSFVLRNL
jgi:predicted nucleotidyltransferase